MLKHIYESNDMRGKWYILGLLLNIKNLVEIIPLKNMVASISIYV